MPVLLIPTNLVTDIPTRPGTYIFFLTGNIGGRSQMKGGAGRHRRSQKLPGGGWQGGIDKGWRRNQQQVVKE